MNATRKCTLLLTADNAAFGDSREEAALEVARILRDTAQRLEEDPESFGRCFQTLRDLNGNDVGRFGLKERGEFFHDCTVPAAKDRKPGGKLERFHGASSLDTYAAGQHDARPGWRQAKDAKRAAAVAKKARRA